MANNLSNIYDIPLAGANLNLNKYNADVKAFNGFNELNSPYYGGVLSPFWRKKESALSSAVYDNDGNAFFCVFNNVTHKTDVYKKAVGQAAELIGTIAGQKFRKEKLFNGSKNIVCVVNENAYIYLNENRLVCRYSGKDVVISPDGLSYDYLPKCTAKIIGNIFYFICQNGIYGWVDTDGNFKTLNAGEFYNSEKLDIFTITADSRTYFVWNGYSHWKGVYLDTDPRFESTSDITQVRLFNPVLNGGAGDYVNINVDKLIVANDDYLIISGDVSGSNTADLLLVAKKSDDLISFYTGGITSFTGGTFSRRIGLTKYLESTSLSQNHVTRTSLWANLSSHYATTIFQCDQNVRSMTQISVDSDFKKLSYNTGYKTRLNYQSVESQTKKNTWNVLINNEVVSGISCNDTLLTEWLSVDDVFKVVCPDDNSVIYKDSDGTVYKISLSEENPVEVKFIDDRYIVFNVPNRECLNDDIKHVGNCYDLELNAFCDYASDNNNNGYLGIEVNAEIGGNAIGENDYFPKSWCVYYDKFATDYETVLNNMFQGFMSSSYNANYEIKNRPPQAMINPIDVYSVFNPTTDYLLKSSVLGPVNFISAINKSDVYVTREVNDTAEYLCTVLFQTFFSMFRILSVYNVTVSGYVFKDSELEDVLFPVEATGNILFTPNMFSVYIRSYMNKDLILDEDTGYPLTYYNNRLVLAYYMLSAMEKVTSMFVVNGQTYGVSNNIIFACSYSNGVIANIQPVANVTNMEFLGSNLQQALFWCKTNKTVYSFSGDNVLSVAFSSSMLDDIYFSSYNPTTNSIYICTNKGVYILGNNGTYRIIDKVAQRIFTWKGGLIIVVNSYVYFYSFNQIEDFEKQNVNLETMYYGLANYMKSITDCVYLRLHSENRESGEVKIKVSVLNLEGITTEETVFRINGDEWDKETDTILLRYQPQKQRAIGTSVKIDSPFAIGYMGVGNIQDTKVVDNVSKTAINLPDVGSKYNF